MKKGKKPAILEAMFEPDSDNSNWTHDAEDACLLYASDRRLTMSLPGSLGMGVTTARIASALGADQRFRDIEYREHRATNALMTSVVAAMGTALWAWDYAHDPTGAQHTVWLRAVFLPSALPYLATLAFRVPWPLAWLAASMTILAWESGFVLILSHLQGAASYGISGFAYFLAMPLLMMRGFVFGANVALTLLIVALPLVLACFGWGPGFENVRYAEFTIPFAVASMAALFAYGQLYAITCRTTDTDPLTGLGNRRRFTEALRDEVTRGRHLQHPLSLILVDIDLLNQINSTHGYSAGNQVIRAVGSVCREGIRDVDIATRVDGDEFGLILVGTPVENAIGTARRIRHQIEQLQITAANGHRLGVTVSIGLAESLHSGSIVDAAEEALYRAKKSGRNRFAVS
ncbi:sensor domain-containing diguanylate cyclase [Cupriavidus sp. D39]|uniref:GGDEF domain-containing protein n=1 Tax=Cupriavidus sp. D39 TaxID=2997877 RepID=UPI0022709EC4|nr:GGDEF domain-containing protein [Cupriavidus sp. D39]MCY0854925.1 GGDEF domain-containing protein [Cupriavidus sp. D39]